MGKEEIAEKLRNPLTPRAFIIGLFISIVSSLIGVWGGGFDIGIADKTAWTMIIIAILSLLITPWLKSIGFSTGELVIVYVMTVTNAYTGWNEYGPLTRPFSALESPTVGTQAQQWMPDIWFPKDPTIYKPMLLGGAAVPWGAWMIPILYWITLQLCWMGIGLTFGFILRRSLIEVERLPFPYTQVLQPLIVKPERPLRERINVPLLLVGFVVGFIIQGTYSFFPLVIPGFPDIYPKSLWGMRGYDWGEILGADIYRNQMLFFFLDGAISGFGLFFLLPTKVLASALLVHFIWGNLLPYVEVSLGMVTNTGNFGLYSIIGWYFNMLGTAFEPTGIQWYSVLTLGYPIGFVFTYLFFARREISASLKDALRGTRSETIAWTLFAASIIGYVALTAGSGVTLMTTLAFLVLSFVFLVQTIRMRGETIRDADPIMANVLQLSWETAGGEATRNTQTMFRDGMMCGLIVNQGFMLCGRTPVWVPFEGMRLLEMSGEKWDWKPLGLAVVVSLIANLIIIWVVNLLGLYTYGQLVKWNTRFWSENAASDIENFNSVLNVPGSYATGTVPLRPIEIFSGAILGIAVTALNSMFMWWPIHPLGFLLGINLGWGLWNWALLAFIARFIILKVGGSKLYNKALQVVLGSLIGYGLISILEYAAIVFIKIG